MIEIKDKQLIKYLEKALKEQDKDKIEETFNLIYYQYAKLIKYVSYGIVKNSNDADDIVQDTFLSFYNNINNIKLTNIKYYLVVSAKNLSINHIKSFNNKMEKLDIEMANEIATSESKINQMMDELHEILSDFEIDIIIKHLVFNYKFKEIAKENKVTTSVIVNKYARAINKFNEKRIK